MSKRIEGLSEEDNERYQVKRNIHDYISYSG